MKKTISLVLAGVLALGLLTGCQATPDTPAVIIKDQEQMLETAANGRENSALFASLEVPDRFTGEWTGLNGKLTVKADAEILLPNADKIPTGRVTAREFTQDDLDIFLRVFLKGQPYYNEPTVELEDTQLMSFPEITDIFQRMIMVKNSYQEAGNGTTYYVNRVHLGLMRIKAKDTRGEGLLVPVWDFWGTKDFPSDSGEYVDEQILLTINAIDGTVIDRSLGY